MQSDNPLGKNGVAAPSPVGGAAPLAWSLSPDGWRDLLAGAGQPAFRARQIWEWLYVKCAQSYADMSNIPAALRTRLEGLARLSPWTAADSVRDGDGTEKLLLECRDGVKIESVVIPSDGGATLCVSTQAGCAFGCAFCATGQCGLDRNLETGEIVGQFMAALAAAPDRRPDHIVFMGMGEPFANYDNVLAAVRIFNDHSGLDIGARRMTLSTCGVVPGIRRLAGENIQVELAISLHAPNDALRSRIMPVNRRWPVAELVGACRDYHARTGRIVTFEYTLVGGLNDTDACARELVGLASPAFARFNLIPLSPVRHFDGAAPEPRRIRAFSGILRGAGFNVTLRHSKGSSVTAACGQLRLAHAGTRGDF